MTRRTGAVLVFATAFIVSANTLANGFVWDDLIGIVQNPWIRDPALLPQAFVHDLAGFAPGYSTSYYRPLLHVANAAVYAAAGPSPWAFHLLNVLVHAGASACVLLLAWRWAPELPALLAAMLFAVHPAHTEAVAWASGLCDLGAAIGVLLALVALGRDLSAWAAPLLFAIALLFKEPALALLAIAPLVTRRRRILVALALVAAAYVAARVHALGGLVAGRQSIEAGLVEAALTPLALLARYAATLLVPLDLSPVHDLAVSSRPDAWVAGGVAVVACASFALWRGSPAVRIAVALAVVPLLPCLYVPALKDSLFAERYLYLPSAGVALLLALALARVPSRLPTYGTAVLAAIFAFGTVSRNAIWHDNVSLWSDAAMKAPRSAVAWESLGGALALNQRYDDAIPPLTRAVLMDPRRYDAHANLALCLGATGRRREAMPHAFLAATACPQCPERRAIVEWLARIPEG